MSQKIGFIGLGIMGQPMAENILKNGYGLMVYNRSKDKTKILAEKGAFVADTPADLTKWAEIIILMLTGPEAIDAVVYGENGILSAMPSGITVINMSTVSPMYTRNLQICLEPSGISFVDCPVGGSKKPAIDGSLVILAGGEKDTVKTLEPLLLSMGKKVIYCGESGQGSAMKMTINLLLATMIEGFSEALNLAQKNNLDTDMVIDSILASHLGCGLFNFKSEMLRKNDFPVQFPLKHMTKDLRFVLQTADESGAAVPAGHAIFQVYRQGIGLGNGDLDFAAVKKTLEALNDQ